MQMHHQVSTWQTRLAEQERQILDSKADIVTLQQHHDAVTEQLSQRLQDQQTAAHEQGMLTASWDADNAGCH